MNLIIVTIIQDLSQFYKDKNLVRLEGESLPFENNQFDFVIASHVIEHVNDFKNFKVPECPAVVDQLLNSKVESPDTLLT